MNKTQIKAIICVALATSIINPSGCFLANHDGRILDTPIKGSMMGEFLKNQLSNDLQDLNTEDLPRTAEGQRSLDIQRPLCQIIQIVHLLKHPGCQSKAIASFACLGFCSSYVQMSASMFWQHERSCSCCQQTGLQEATFTLDCPSLSPPYKKIKTYSPVDCMCRACTDLGKENLQPGELVEVLSGELSNKNKF